MMFQYLDTQTATANRSLTICLMLGSKKTRDTLEVIFWWETGAPIRPTMSCLSKSLSVSQLPLDKVGSGGNFEDLWRLAWLTTILTTRIPWTHKAQIETWWNQLSQVSTWSTINGNICRKRWTYRPSPRHHFVLEEDHHLLFGQGHQIGTVAAVTLDAVANDVPSHNLHQQIHLPRTPVLQGVLWVKMG
jgi:hypothetical protein